MPVEMQLSCTIHDNKSNGTSTTRIIHGEENNYEDNGKFKVCEPWTNTAYGIKAMVSHVMDVYVDFKVTYPVYLATNGQLIVKFRVDDSDLNVFKILVDGEIKFSVGSADGTFKDYWTTHVEPLK